MAEIVMAIEDIPKCDEVLDNFKQFSESEQIEMLNFMQIFMQGVRYERNKAAVQPQTA